MPIKGDVREFLQRWNPSSRYESSVLEEYDDHVRPADLWLYCSPVGGSGSSSHRRSNQYSSGETAVNKQYSHWILVFKFQDQTISAIDGLNEDDHLAPSYWKRIDESWTPVKKIDTVNISPKRVREFAVKHPLNGQGYSLLGFNCHVWANRVLKALGLEELPNTINNDILDTIGITAAITAGGVVASLLYMLAK